MKKVLFPLVLLSFSGANAQSWVPQATNLALNAGVDEIAIVDPNTVWITAYDGSGSGAYLHAYSRTSDGGNTWTAGSIAGTGMISTAVVGDIAAVDANTAWVVTAPTSGTAGNGIWKTTNGGTTWTLQTSPYNTSSFADVIYFWDANNGFSAGDPVGGNFQILKTSNGGTTWTAVSGTPASLGSSDGAYTGIKKVVGDNIWLGTTMGRILHSTDRGLTWSAYFSPVLDFGGIITPNSFGHFAFKDANNGLLIAVDNSTDAVMYSTTDGGANWDPIDPTGTWFFGDIAYVPGTSNTYVSSGIDSTAAQGVGSSYSTDGGNTWTIIDNDDATTGGQRGRLNFLSQSTGWCGFFSDGNPGTTGIFKFDGSLGVADVNAVKSNLKVYPNPAVDIVNIKADKDIKSVTLYDTSGKKVKSYTGSEINVSSLTKGTYMLQVYYGNGAVENTKLIKK